MPSKLITSAAAVAVLALLPASAGAQAGSRTFAATYPHASALCARAAAGNLPKSLAGEVAPVTTACNALQSSFTGAQTTVQAAQLTFRNGVQSARAQRRAACQRPRQQPTCRNARIQERTTVRMLRLQHRTAVHTYYIVVEGARRTFWSTIHALRGGSTIPADTPIPTQSS